MATNVELTSLAPALNSDQIIVNEGDSGAAIMVDVGDVKLKRVPKRILHFSDGTLEEFSSSDDDETDKADVNKNVLSQALIDTASLTWGPYLWYRMAHAGSKTLAACDFLGEHLANFFGITSPKYQFEVDEYFRQKAEEEKLREQKEDDLRNWTVEKSTTVVTVAEQPATSTEWQRIDV